MDWLKIALNGLQIGSIMATAGFAAFGLISRFKDDKGSLTKSGRVALAGIGLSALLSLSTQSVKAEADRRSSEQADEKHQAELAKELDLFAGQSVALTQVDAKQRRALAETQLVQDRLSQSLSALQLVQRNVARSVSAIDIVGQKQDSHTARMLRTMWEDSNRIDGNRIEILMVNQCVASGSGEIPSILPAGATARIAVAPASMLSSLHVPLNTFSTDLLLDSVSPVENKTVTFSSMSQRVDVAKIHSVDTTVVMQQTRFGPFMTQKPGAYSSPEEWRSAVVEILISGQQGGLANAVKEATDERLEGKEELARRYTIPGNIRLNDDYIVNGLPCETSLYLMLNGRIVATGDVSVVQVSEWDEDVRGLVVVKSPVVPIIASALPQFSLAELR